METRAYRAEVGISLALSKYFDTIFASPVKRIPAMGSTGPDIEVNEIGLVVDVKSRKSIPTWMFESSIYKAGDFFFVQLCKLNLLENLALLGFINCQRSIPKKVLDWWNHMDEWRIREQPNGLTALALHRSNSYYKNQRSEKGSMRYEQSMLMIKYSNLEVLSARLYNSVQRISRPDPVPTVAIFRDSFKGQGADHR